jgi:DNA-binding CsgD family transcriptional regulator
MSHETNLLSERERDVVRVLLQGKSNKQIALELGISNRTVEFHLQNIYTKLGVASRAEAILKLTDAGPWKPTGDLPVESTVEKIGNPTDNDIHVISWRIPVKKFYYGLAAGALLTALVAVLIAFNVPARNVALTSTPALPTATVPAPTIVPTETLPAPTATAEPEPGRIVIPPHTVSGVTAAIESYYIDLSHLIFQLRFTTEDPQTKFEPNQLGVWDIYDEYGNLVNSSVGLAPAMDPELVQLSFVPVTLLKGDRFKGQLRFNINAGPPNYEPRGQFSFDLDLPIYPEVRFYPRQTVSANGIDMLVDSVTVTPVYTQVYLCYQPPSFNPWVIGNGTVIEMAGHQVPIHNTSGLFSSFTGSYWGTHSEPYWVPPVKNGVCDKIGFNVGTSNPTSLQLTITSIDNILPYLQSPIDLDALYPGLPERQAYHTYLEENGYTIQGPWTFDIELIP